MTDSEKKPTTDELLARIEHLEAKLERLAEVNYKSHEVMRYHLDIHDRQIDGALESIKGLELHAFPQAAGDIIAIHHVIGDGENRADNPLDHKTPPPIK